jgi:hypothetical protein
MKESMINSNGQRFKKSIDSQIARLRLCGGTLLSPSRGQKAYESRANSERAAEWKKEAPFSA